MKWKEKQRMIAELDKAWKHQMGIVNKYGKLVIHPGDSKEYHMNKTIFDTAYHLAGQIEKEKARLVLNESNTPDEFDRIMKKLGANTPPGAQIKPSQTKVKL